jgi:transposase
MYSIELRERVIKAYEAGQGSYPAIGALFAVGEATVKRWVTRYHKDGVVTPRPRGGGTVSTIDAAEIERMLAQLGDPTAGELTVEFNRSRRGPARVHVSSMKRALYRYGYVVKKSVDGRWRVNAPTSS